MADVGAHAAPLSQALLATMADTADQFLAAAYDVLMSNVRKVPFFEDQLQPTVSSVLIVIDFAKASIACSKGSPCHPQHVKSAGWLSCADICLMSRSGPGGWTGAVEAVAG